MMSDEGYTGKKLRGGLVMISDIGGDSIVIPEEALRGIVEGLDGLPDPDRDEHRPGVKGVFRPGVFPPGAKARTLEYRPEEEALKTLWHHVYGDPLVVGSQPLAERIRRLETDYRHLNSKVLRAEGRTAGLDERVEALEVALNGYQDTHPNGLKHRVGVLEADLGAAPERLNILETRVDNAWKTIRESLRKYT